MSGSSLIWHGSNAHAHFILPTVTFTFTFSSKQKQQGWGLSSRAADAIIALISPVELGVTLTVPGVIVLHSMLQQIVAPYHGEGKER